MRYLILDYAKGVSKVKKKHILYKFLKLFKQYEKYKQYKQLKFIQEELTCGNMEFLYVNVQASPKELQKLSLDKIRQKLWNTITEKYSDKVRLLTCQSELITYLPPQIQICDDVDEVYIILLKNYFRQLWDNQNAAKNQQLLQKTARLLFLDDGTRDAVSYIRQLSGEWNYVTVCSIRHEELEAVYRELYEEEGLMIQCVDYGVNRSVQERVDSTEHPYKNINHIDKTTNHIDKGTNHMEKNTVVIDLTSEWKGIHRIYPENSYVYDITFSREKQAYLKAKQVRLANYVQIADIRKA